ncbi:hypothetical protein BGZ46_008132 [Entomortierella lignicola]|nr:hypothetical protein BGZ46_008132 [Entomortierella lignicola]
MSNQESLSRILAPSNKGSSYFLSKIDGDADSKGYVHFRKQLAVINSGGVAKEWNGFMKLFKSCESVDWREYARTAPSMTKNMVLHWSNEDGDGPSAPDSENNNEGSSGSSASTSTSPLPNEIPSPQCKRNGSTTSGKRKRQSFGICIKDRTTPTLNVPNQDSELPAQSSSLKLAFKKFQASSAKLVLPSRDISMLLPEALSLNGIWWVDKASLGLPSNEHVQYLDSLRSVGSLNLCEDLLSIAIEVQLKLQNVISQEQWMDYMHGLYNGSFEKKQAVIILQRLVEILPTNFQPNEELGETGFILTRLQCFLDVIFGQLSHFPILCNIEHDSGKSAKSGHDKGVRSDFFIEVPCGSFSSIHNSEIVGLLGEVKSPEKERRQCIKIQDFWKLVRMAKDEINAQILKGVTKPMVVFIQVFGFQLEMFMMTMDPNEGLYILHTAAEGFLPRSRYDISSGTGFIIAIFQHAKVKFF